jgi:hypothetical protein
MKYQTVELGFTTHILHKFWYIHVLQAQKWKYIEICFPEGVFEQNKQAHPNYTIGPEYQWGRHPDIASSPPEQGGAERAGPGCRRTHGAGAPPLAPLRPTFLWRYH